VSDVFVFILTQHTIICQIFVNQGLAFLLQMKTSNLTTVTEDMVVVFKFFLCFVTSKY